MTTLVPHTSSSKPNFICVAEDVNVLAISRTDEFQRFVTAYKIAYREAKKISPQTKICVSFQYEVSRAPVHLSSPFAFSNIWV